MPPPCYYPNAPFLLLPSICSSSSLFILCRQTRLLSQSGLGLLVEHMMMGCVSHGAGKGLVGHQHRLRDALPLQHMWQCLALLLHWARPSGRTLSLLLMFLGISCSCWPQRSAVQS